MRSPVGQGQSGWRTFEFMDGDNGTGLIVNPEKNVHAAIPPALLAAAERAALDDHVTVDDFVRDAVAHRLEERQCADKPEFEPEEWVERFRSWTRSHAGDRLPVLSDDAISRESIYEGRGL